MTNPDPETTPGAFRLRRLEIRRFRHVRPGTVLEFADGHNMLLGRNGTGKTTLLDLIAATLRGDFRAYRGEELDLAWEGVSDGCGWSGALTLGPPRRGGHSPGPATWRAQIEGASRDGVAVSATSSEHGVQWSAAEESGAAGALDPTSVGALWMGLLAQIRGVSPSDTGGVWHFYAPDLAFRFDEALDTFAHLHSGAWAYRDRDDPSAIGELRQAAERLETMSDGDQPDTLTVAGRVEAAFEQATGLRDVEAVLDRAGGQHFVAYSGMRTFFTTATGTRLRHERLSFGQKRLLTALHLLESPLGIFIADELVNGLHHEWIELLMARLEGTQTFLASQNPLLLDHLEFDDPAEVRRSFVLCATADDGTWSWRKPTEDEATRFFRAYAVGIQHVSEVLRDKGLW